MVTVGRHERPTDLSLSPEEVDTVKQMEETDLIEAFQQLNRVSWMLGLPPTQKHAIRVKAKIGLRELAATVGVDRTTLWRWETGIRTPTSQIHREAYADVLLNLHVQNRTPPGVDGITKLARSLPQEPYDPYRDWPMNWEDPRAATMRAFKEAVWSAGGLKWLREQSGVTAAEVAGLVDRTSQTVSNWERSRNGGPNGGKEIVYSWLLWKWAQALNIQQMAEWREEFGVPLPWEMDKVENPY